MSVYHGGNLAGAAAEFGIPRDKWIDLSTGINPNPYPVVNISDDLWARLPDQNRLVKLKEAAATYYQVQNPELVIPVSGTQTLLQILPHLFEKPKQVRILEPTYKEHAHCWALAGHNVKGVVDLEAAEKEADIIIVVNPNNPTGQTYQPNNLIALAKRQHKKGGLLIVDGAFVDCMADADISSHAGMDGLLILRSFGKFFGLAGIRLGFVLAGGALAERLKEGVGPWAVNGPALEIARQAFLDQQWIDETKIQLHNQAKRLDQLLTQNGYTVRGGTSLFRFVQCQNGQDLYHKLGQQGILIRPFADIADCVRMGLPKDESEWQKLKKIFKLISV
ncbi:MAG: threonine-phosphate decarboxylase [Methylocystaceae bacterium]|nr:threonine-phosphate decarboxylase [Methylocystaceae bacterium]